MAKRSCLKAREFDDVLEKVGSFGRYQKLRIALFFVPVSFILGFSSVAPMFELVVPPHWCHVPGRENTSFTAEEWRNLTIPTKSDDPSKLSSCLMYDGFWEMHNGSPTYTVTNETKKCSHGWEFDRSDFSETDATIHGWVCDDKAYVQHSLSIGRAGMAVGTFILPMMADKFFGRRCMFFIAISTQVIFTLPLLFVSSPQARLLFRFLQGTGFESNYLMPYAILMEIIPPSRRDVTVMITFVSWGLGLCFMALVAWLAGHWKVISCTSFIPFLLFFAYWRVLPESPRWLLSKGRLRECADILLKIGAVNGNTTISREEVEEELHHLSLHMPANEPLTKAFIYPKLRLRIAMTLLLSFISYMAYGVLLLSMTVMPGNYFLGHLILTLFEIPSMFVGLAVIHYFGRRCQGFSFLLVKVVSFIAAAFFVHRQWVLLGILAVAKLAVTCNLYLVFLLPSEIFPTPIRTSAAGMMIVCGLMGMALAPQLLLSGIGDTFHYWFLAATGLLGMLILAPIPETLGLLMPQTFLDGEELGHGRPLTTWIHKWNVHKYPNVARHDQNEETEDLMQGKDKYGKEHVVLG